MSIVQAMPYPAAAGGGTAFNPADTHPGLALSNGNRTVTRAAGNQSSVTARSVTEHSSGKRYFEAVMNDRQFTAGLRAGIANLAHPLDAAPGGSHDSIALGTSGIVEQAGGFRGEAGAIAVGNRVDMAVDLDNRRIWFRVNGGNWNNNASANPATNAGGISMNSPLDTGVVHVAVSGWGVPDQWIGSFQTSDLVGTVPTGFSAWE